MCGSIWDPYLSRIHEVTLVYLGSQISDLQHLGNIFYLFDRRKSGSVWIKVVIGEDFGISWFSIILNGVLWICLYDASVMEKRRSLFLGFYWGFLVVVLVPLPRDDAYLQFPGYLCYQFGGVKTGFTWIIWWIRIRLWVIRDWMLFQLILDWRVHFRFSVDDDMERRRSSSWGSYRWFKGFFLGSLGRHEVDPQIFVHLLHRFNEIIVVCIWVDRLIRFDLWDSRDLLVIQGDYRKSFSGLLIEVFLLVSLYLLSSQRHLQAKESLVLTGVSWLQENPALETGFLQEFFVLWFYGVILVHMGRQRPDLQEYGYILHHFDGIKIGSARLVSFLWLDLGIIRFWFIVSCEMEEQRSLPRCYYWCFYGFSLGFLGKDSIVLYIFRQILHRSDGIKIDYIWFNWLTWIVLWVSWARLMIQGFFNRSKHSRVSIETSLLAWSNLSASQRNLQVTEVSVRITGMSSQRNLVWVYQEQVRNLFDWMKPARSVRGFTDLLSVISADGEADSKWRATTSITEQ